MKFEDSSKKYQSLKKLINYKGVIIFSVVHYDNTLIFNSKSTKGTCTCPDCKRRSKVVRGRYTRSLLDFSIYTFKTIIQLVVRKFKCLNSKCRRKIFSEQFIGVTKRYARMTNLLKDMLSKVLVEVSAKKGSYLSYFLNINLSPSTCLRYVHQLEVATQFDVAHIGIDDWAYRKGKSYGTIVVDSQTKKTIDLIKTRSTDQVTKYLKQYATLDTITRDRASSYASAINNSHPNAIQIADKFHLVKNFGDAVYEEIQYRYSDIMKERLEQSEECMQVYKKTLPDTAIPQATANVKYHPISNQSIISPTRQKLFEQVHELIGEGMSLRRIARELGVDKNKIRSLAGKKTLEGKQIVWQNNYIAHIDNIISGCRQGILRHDIYKMIVENGFQGKRTSFYAWFNKSFPDYINCRKEINKDALNNLSKAIKKQSISSRKLSIYVTAPTFGVNKSTGECSDEYKFTHELIDKSIELTKIKSFSEQFRCILKEGDDNALGAWLERVLKSDFKKLHSFAKGIKKDIGAVTNAINYNYTNGLVEGCVNRLKTKKREMYGRAGFELLRRKVCLSVMG